MIFFPNQPKQQQIEYKKFLKIAGCLSNLFSDSPIPYLYYRIAEKIFCKSFQAEDLSRSDVSADAKKDKLGIGLKTFLVGNSKTYQKVAEFNSDRALYENLNAEKLVLKIAELRNARINFTEKAHGLENSIYHCVLRDKGKFLIFEEPMNKIEIGSIKNIKKNTGSIFFQDGKNDYSFLVSKSTLTKRFVTENILHKFEVEILEDPLAELEKLLNIKGLEFESKTKIKQTVFLPLYGRNQTVFEKSGLNQWNAGGRPRDINEVYIPIPAEIHKNFPNFFPARDIPFFLKFPDGENVESKICQDGGKALMTKSNKKLGKLILRDGLNLKEGELVTYEKLQTIGIDSVRIDKISDDQFEINFSATGSYNDFKENLNL
ncbi:NgoFVII family restriction endonuclease [Candidatus Wolfebacteria bacterium CG_4_10_14_0_8_um_filter_37_11]|uniref:NgoFVII family restriction endonuclease n=1 Tax=Candidatus Wolfebacteria bacterium CG_4_10_14_0_8_um_filter_37_11 TaxID=1975062 RepID=A0A2M7Q8F3_9BACT|nr:MAG: NgoFVII family restriction endonuclease [Candidatus Berkelbacteria bacterium CG10_big_fil_rev_8_21_14_0_10_33_10]PIY59706.1 MAG: NgoFVII family restriction endonuclease [Candidatus Wolfebacteria bacterium CG_4_10_14_0_8_um_filter_37_11]PJA84262.1 MAG: NgoFVII family restriction endonuclease [Candidatus Nealsonbacteria bacterium CG_4_9_14_3_um_filter_35_11]